MYIPTKFQHITEDQRLWFPVKVKPDIKIKGGNCKKSSDGTCIYFLTPDNPYKMNKLKIMSIIFFS